MQKLERTAKDTMICKDPATFFQISLVQPPLSSSEQGAGVLRGFGLVALSWLCFLGWLSGEASFSLQLPIGAYRWILWRAWEETRML